MAKAGQRLDTSSARVDGRSVIGMSGWRIAAKLVRLDAGSGQQLGIPRAGMPVEQARPRGRRGARRGRAQQPQVDVLPERQPGPDLREQLRLGVAQPPKAEREVARMQPAPGALLDGILVQLPTQGTPTSAAQRESAYV